MCHNFLQEYLQKLNGASYTQRFREATVVPEVATRVRMSCCSVETIVREYEKCVVAVTRQHVGIDIKVIPLQNLIVPRRKNFFLFQILRIPKRKKRRKKKKGRRPNQKQSGKHSAKNRTKWW